MAKRKIFDELMEGVNAMKKHSEGKVQGSSCRSAHVRLYTKR